MQREQKQQQHGNKKHKGRFFAIIESETDEALDLFDQTHSCKKDFFLVMLLVVTMSPFQLSLSLATSSLSISLPFCPLPVEYLWYPMVINLPSAATRTSYYTAQHSSSSGIKKANYLLIRFLPFKSVYFNFKSKPTCKLTPLEEDYFPPF